MVVLTAINAPEDVRHRQTETAAFVGESDFGLGTLYVAESVVIWISNDGRGFALSYPSISMHAISRDTQNFSQPCIYMVVECPDEKIGGRETNVAERCFAEKLAACSLKTDSAAAAKSATTDTSGDGDHNGSAHDESDNGDEDDDDDQVKTMEVRFVPSDTNALENIYHALSECQALHPDEDESFSEDEDEDGGQAQFGGASDEVQFDENGQLVLSRMRGVWTGDDDAMEHDEPVVGRRQHRPQDDEEMETGQFEDAPE